MAAPRPNLLTEQQRDYLRLVGAGLTSKEIAQKLGGSYHTINVEIGVAVRMLGAADRKHAAAMIAAEDGSYEPSYDSQMLADPATGTAIQVPGKATRSHWLPLPIATAWRPFNELTFWQRTGWIIVLATLVAIIVGGLLSGIFAQLDALGRRV